jgi:hypothetical protein
LPGKPIPRTGGACAFTDYGFAMLREGEEIFDELRHQWEKQVGAGRLTDLEVVLRELAGSGAVRIDMPGWVARDLSS